MRVVDCDQHAVLPGDDWWTPRLPERYSSWMPVYRVDERGERKLFVEGRVIEQPTPTLFGKPLADGFFGATEGATLTPGSWREEKPEAISPADALRRGGVDAPVRLEVMDREGIEQAFIFPSKILGLMPALTSSSFALAVARAYNDWMFDYCSAAPDRLRPIAVVPQQDLVLACEEAERAHARGVCCIHLRPNTVAGMNLSHPAYDRLWSTCERLGLAAMIHEGYGLAKIPRVGVERVRTTLQGHAVSHPFEHMMACLLLITDGVFERFPRLHVAFMESGAGWAPFWLHRLDEHAEVFKSDHTPRLPEKPSTYFKRQCFIGVEPGEPFLRHLLDFGLEDTLLFTTDFPHFDAAYPGGVQKLRDRTDVSERQKELMLWRNAARLFGFGTPA
jgi:predicted TIM-barrel fold metal-dependent hydrolase